MICHFIATQGEALWLQCRLGHGGLLDVPSLVSHWQNALSNTQLFQIRLQRTSSHDPHEACKFMRGASPPLPDAPQRAGRAGEKASGRRGAVDGQFSAACAGSRRSSRFHPMCPGSHHPARPPTRGLDGGRADTRAQRCTQHPSAAQAVAMKRAESRRFRGAFAAGSADRAVDGR